MTAGYNCSLKDLSLSLLRYVCTDYAFLIVEYGMFNVPEEVVSLVGPTRLLAEKLIRINEVNKLKAGIHR